MNIKRKKSKNRFSIESLEKRFGVMTLGMFIQSFREADEISQVEYAKKLGISRANLCDLEKGRKLASPARAAAIAKAIGVAEEALVKLSIQDSLRAADLDYQVDLKAA